MSGDRNGTRNDGELARSPRVRQFKEAVRNTKLPGPCIWPIYEQRAQGSLPLSGGSPGRTDEMASLEEGREK